MNDVFNRIAEDLQNLNYKDGDTVGTLLQRAVDQAGMSRRDLARRANVAQPYLNQVFRDQVKISKPMAIACADVLELHAETLVTLQTLLLLRQEQDLRQLDRMGERPPSMRRT